MVLNAAEEKLCAALLVGGKSRRMGRDKALIEVGGLPMYERVLNVLRSCLQPVYLIGDAPQRFEGLPEEVVPDVFPGSSLGGIYTALFHSKADYVFVAACDLPFASPEIMTYLLSLRHDYDVVVPSGFSGLEPLFAVYSNSCLIPFRSALECGCLRIISAWEGLRVREVGVKELAPLADLDQAFFNVNCLTDLEHLNSQT